MDVIDLFREGETVDELGIGSVRDTFSDLLFPGTSAIQTRAKYFLIVPWTYLRLERSKTESAVVAAEARAAETNLIGVLEASDDTNGIIGVRARKSLKRLPSMVYWQGLGRLGIRRYPGSRDQYHRSLDAYYKRVAAGTIRNDDKEIIESSRVGNWDKQLPRPASGFPRECSLRLTAEEAEYLCDRIRHAAPQSLFAHLVDVPVAGSDVEFPWEHAGVSHFPTAARQVLAHAQNFSECLHGAPLLYNLMLSELAGREDWADYYRDQLTTWAESLQRSLERLLTWNLEAFWRTVSAANPRVPVLTKQFIDSWLVLVRRRRPFAATDGTARELIAARERHLKRGLARIDGGRALELYQGDAGTRQIDYRWKATVRQMLVDIREGLGDAAS